MNSGIDFFFKVSTKGLQNSLLPTDWEEFLYNPSESTYMHLDGLCLVAAINPIIPATQKITPHQTPAPIMSGIVSR